MAQPAEPSDSSDDGLAELAGLAEADSSDDGLAELAGLAEARQLPAGADDAVEQLGDHDGAQGGPGPRAAGDRPPADEELTPHQKRMRFANAVRLSIVCRDKREQEENAHDAAKAADDRAVVSAAFNLRADTVETAGLTMEKIEKYVWRTMFRAPGRAQRTLLALSHHQLAVLARTILWRYHTHQELRLKQCISRPVLCCSLRVKWDETVQRLRAQDWETGQDTQTTVSTLVVIAWFKTSEMVTAQFVSTPLVQLSRLTADCIYAGISRALPFWVEDVNREDMMARWLIFVLVADNASSNKRLEAFVRQICREKRAFMLVVRIRCFVHLLHRCLVPAVMYLGLSTPLYRAANCMAISSYWMGLCRGLRNYVARYVTPVHHLVDDPADRQVAADILRLTSPGPI